MSRNLYRSRRVRLPDFMWQTLDILAEYANDKAVLQPEERISVSGLLQVIILSAVKVPLLEKIAETSPEYHEAIAAWVAQEIDRDPRAATIFSLPVWNFTRRTN